MMSRSDIRTELLDRVDEEVVGGNWTLAAYNRYINRAYKDWVENIHNMCKRYYTTSTTISTVASTWTVSLPDDCHQILSIYDSDGNALLWGSINDFDETATGQPSYYCHYGNTSICFNVTPDSAYSYTINYVYEPDDLSSDTDEPDIPLGTENIIILKAAFAMLNARGDDTQSLGYELKRQEDRALARIATRKVGEPPKIRHGNRNYGINDGR